MAAAARKTALVATLALAVFATAATAAPLPHLMYLLVDDWGHADVGYHRPGFNETVTPNIDALVAAGVELNQAYVHKYCSPTRSSIQSGRLPYHVNVLNDDMAIWNPNDPVSGFAGIPRNMTTIAMHLQGAGYKTHMAGKWRVATNMCTNRIRRTRILTAKTPQPTAAPRANKPLFQTTGTREWRRPTTRRTGAATIRACCTSTTRT
jgi:arylsulfatase A-like enzyme